MNNSRKALSSIFLLALAIVVLDSFGKFFSLYWSVWWFDIFMHFLGGAWVGLVLIALSRFAPAQIKKLIPAHKASHYFIAVLAVGIGWEIYEIFAGLVKTPEPYYLDTLIDLVMDMLGAFVVRKMFVKNFYNKKIQ